MKEKQVICALLVLCAVCGMLSCTDMDEYRKISGDKEIVYPGKIESVTIYSGDERIVVKGLCNSDPKVVSCRVYWNLGGDYAEIPVDMSGGPYPVEKEIALPEGAYNFDIYTYDGQGNRSIPVNATGKTYGERYKASISNRLVRSFAVQNGLGVIDWWELDATLGPYETEIVYTDASGMKVTKTAPIEETRTVLENYDGISDVEYTTLYRPDPLCVDIFRSVTNIVPRD